MQLKPYKQNNGFTLFEMVLVIVLISWLGIIIFDRIWKYRVYAEEAAVVATVGNIRSSIGLEFAKLAVRGQLNSIYKLEGTNPMNLLAQPPNKYLGELTNISNIKETGVWYFDRKERTLNYIVSYTDHFKSDVKGVSRTRHKLKLVYTDRNNNKRFDKGIDDINGLDLVALEPFKWFIEK